VDVCIQCVCVCVSLCVCVYSVCVCVCVSLCVNAHRLGLLQMSRADAECVQVLARTGRGVGLWKLMI